MIKNVGVPGSSDKFSQLNKVDGLIDLVERKAVEVFPAIKQNISGTTSKPENSPLDVKSYFENSKFTNLV